MEFTGGTNIAPVIPRASHGGTGDVPIFPHFCDFQGIPDSPVTRTSELGDAKNALRRRFGLGGCRNQITAGAFFVDILTWP